MNAVQTSIELTAGMQVLAPWTRDTGLIRVTKVPKRYRMNLCIERINGQPSPSCRRWSSSYMRLVVLLWDLLSLSLSCKRIAVHVSLVQGVVKFIQHLLPTISYQDDNVIVIIKWSEVHTFFIRSWMRINVPWFVNNITIATHIILPPSTSVHRLFYERIITTRCINRIFWKNPQKF